MSELAMVYKASAADVSRVMGYLRRRNLNPVLLDDAEPKGTYRDQAYEVRIAVPETQREMALNVLTEMESQERTRLTPHTKVAGSAVMLLMVAGGLVALVSLMDRSGKWFIALWLLLTAVAAVALIRWAWGKKPSGK